MRTRAERLKEARTEKGWSKADLRREAKIKSPSTLTELENGSRTESPQWPKLANALGVEVMWLMYEQGPKYREGTPAGPAAGTTSNRNPQEGNVTVLPNREDTLPRHLAELLDIAKAMTTEGQHFLLGVAKTALPQYSKAKANQPN